MKNGRFLFGTMMFLFGLLAGVIAGILFAPRSGQETRRRLGGLVDETGHRVDRMTKATKQAAAEAAKHGKEWAAEAGDHLKNIGQEARKAANVIAEQGKGLIR